MNKRTVSIRNRHLSLRAFNNGLTVVVVLLGLYITSFPFLPYVSLWQDKLGDNTDGVRYSGLLASQSNVDTPNLKTAPKENRLVLPNISFDEPIIVGDDPNNVHLGVWHRPHTSTPDKGGNTVLVGHRFSYSSPATFYHLDKVTAGESFAIWWEGQEYVYTVTETFIVPATAIEIESNTSEAIVTIYTCTPLWTAENRLVVRAKLVNTDILKDQP